ncbi:MAG: apolipoprotein acyltransferase [Pelagimonas sp.]|jgi:uncharacterized membrane protein YfcA|nr:apolipoprotein acyltransferase [Pelagimonas sp.]
MIVIAGAILGAIIGALTARRRKGNGLDILQYGFTYALAFALVGLIATIILEKLL